MILTAHQPVYLPWLGLFHKVALADHFVSFDDVQYSPRDWQNRNRVKTPAGVTWLTVPVLDAGHRDKKLWEMEINNTVPWRRKHWRTLTYSYQKAPFFDLYAGFFEQLYRTEWRLLCDLNHHIFRWLLTTMGFDRPISIASAQGFKGVKSDLVLDMCKRKGATHYIFGSLGTDYADIAEFESAGISVSFQDYKHPVYPQMHGLFVPNLSVIDLLFNCGPAAGSIILSGNQTHVAS
jgi:hypothetical protein